MAGTPVAPMLRLIFAYHQRVMIRRQRVHLPTMPCASTVHKQASKRMYVSPGCTELNQLRVDELAKAVSADPDIQPRATTRHEQSAVPKDGCMWGAANMFDGSGDALLQLLPPSPLVEESQGRVRWLGVPSDPSTRITAHLQA